MIVALWIAVLVLAAITTLLTLVVSGLVQTLDELRVVDTALRSFGPKGLPVGSIAPPVSGTMPDGTEFDPAALVGRTHLVAFVSPDCAPCEPLLRDLSDRSRTKGLPPTIVVTRRSSKDQPALAGLMDREDVIVLSEREDELSDRYRTHTTPHVFVVDEAGAIRAQGVANSVDSVRELIGQEVGVP